MSVFQRQRFVVKVRRSVWAFVVSLVAALMVPVVAAPAAYASWEPPSVREIGERLLGTAVPDCRTSTGAAGVRWPDGTCGELSYGYGPTPGNAVRPAVSSALAGATRFVEGFKIAGTGCTANKSVCATLALASFAALLGIGAGTLEVLDLFPESNPDYQPPSVEEQLLDVMYSSPGTKYRSPCIDVEPVAIYKQANQYGQTTIDFRYTWSCWVYSIGGSSNSGAGFDLAYQCRESATGNLSPIKYAGVNDSWSGPTSSTPNPTSKIKTLILDQIACGVGDVLTYFSMSEAGGSPGSTDGGPVTFWHAGAPNLEVMGSGDYRDDGSTGGSRLECRDSLGSSYYVETSAPAGTWDIPAPKCLDGDIPTGLDVGTRAPGGGLTADTTYDLSPESLRPDTSSTGAYPLCAGAACTYAVKVDGKVCGVGDADCVRWTQNPAAQCWYGPYTVDRSACYLLERAYEVQSPSVPATRPNTDGDPETSTPPAVETLPPPETTRPAECRSAFFNLGPVQPALVSAVDAVYSANQSAISTVYGHRPSDPYPDHPSGIAADFMIKSTAGGHAVANHLIANASTYNVKYILWNQQSWNPTRGTWAPMSDRGSATANHLDHVHLTINVTDATNLCGASPQPTTGEDVDAPPVEAQECFPSGWGVFNPFSWVYKPVMCALEDAFVPDPALTQQRLDDLRTRVETAGPGPAIVQVTDLIDSVPSEGGCQGPPFTLTLAGETFTLYLLDACDTPMSTVAGFSKALSTMVVVVGGGLAMVRAISAAFGLNFSMGRGGGDDGV